MRFAALWTMLMSVAIGLSGVLLWAVFFGGNLPAWLSSIPGMFVGLQLLGLPVVLSFEAAERAGVVRRTWRPVVDEVAITTCLCVLAWWILPSLLGISIVTFFGAMFFLRIVFRGAWIPGEPVEVSTQ